ncbi:unnamed protein product [Parascedosporium putredinis]|uniref:M protein, serotype 2.1 n=1 Tax=Parascedosporium putredinis TaxID=1442378 RepID=A0A9P1H4C6_9PEZI|nr:unnamed protein product [Parascedosporium putredinis]CAI7995463.1 unnamed protein product [Parascedosporium putredinis]
MATPTRKSATPGVGRASVTDSTSPQSTPSRQTPRSSTPTSNTPGSVNRTRSVRTSAPVSARAAAAGRRESLLGNASTEAQLQAREEAAAALEDLRERLATAEGNAETYRKQLEVLQARHDDTVQEQAKLEERLHEAEEQIESLTNEKREAARKIREMETIYEAERSSMMKEKEEMANREEEMQTVIQRLKESLAAQKYNPVDEDDVRPSRQALPPSRAEFRAPSSSLHRSDSRNNSKLLLQKDKLIESLRLELAEAQIKLVESENQGGGRLQEVERLLMEARMANARLMEDNESYQLLLQERTLNGEFKNSLAFMGGASANQDALNALEGRESGTTLADELSSAVENESDGHRRLEAELKSLREENKALILYIDKTLGKVLGHPEFEAILDQSTAKEKDLPPPPPEKDQQWAGSSIFQRAKFTVGAGPKGPRARPMSVMPMSTTSTPNSIHNNPETAPKIPIGNLTRSTSVRRSRPMSEQFTGAGVSMLGQRYRGADGPASPTFSEPRRSQTFFSPSGLSTAGARSPSGQHAASSGNFPGMRSETSSVSGDSGDITTPPSQSPPRHGAGDKATTFGGNKPRPLRLLQEQESAKSDTANKRASWMGWAAGWGKKEEAAAAGAIAE